MSKEIDLDEWLDKQRQALNDFADDWVENQSKHGTTQWPGKMPAGEWGEHFQSFVGE